MIRLFAIIKLKAAGVFHRSDTLPAASATGTADSTGVLKACRQSMPGLDRLAFFFTVAYLAQGISCAQFGLVRQPVQFYMMDGLGLSAADVSAALALLMVPWIIKPLYGLVSDCFPLFGYRRKSYLIAANLAGAVGFALMCMATSLIGVLLSLALTAICMAAATTLMVAMAVDSGKETGKARGYFRVQEFSFYAASIAVAMVAGYLCHNLAPHMALKVSALVSVFPLLLMAFYTGKMLEEPKTERRMNLDIGAIGQTGRILLSIFATRSIFIVYAFTFLWAFTPAFGVPLYYFQSKTLGFSQEFIGQLSSFSAIGMMLGAILSGLLCRICGPKKQALLTLILLSLSTLGYLTLVTPQIAIVLEVLRGITNLMSIICMHGLAADLCPKGTEATVMAILLAVLNSTTYASNFIGGHLYTHVLNEQFYSLVLISALAPILSAVLLPFLPSESLVRVGK